MDDKTVPYIVYEDAQVRHERTVKRLIIALVIAVVLLFASNAMWLHEWSQYDTVAYTQDGEGINNVNLGEQGDLVNEPESSD